eukprot:24108-Eustigmatos_ZCMA.PRE.1
MVTYSLDVSSKLEVAIIQGLYFAYQSYTLLASQREVGRYPTCLTDEQAFDEALTTRPSSPHARRQTTVS